MTRSLKLRQDCIKKAQLAVGLSGFPSQRALADDVGLVLSTVSNFLTGKAVDCLNFLEICRELGLDWKAIADLRVDPTPTQDQEGPKPKSMDQGNPAFDFYVERLPIESVCYQKILQPGALLRIKAPRRMGKTWLMSKVLNHAANQGYRTVALNLRQAVDQDYTDLDHFLRFFCTSVSLSQPNRVDEHWDNGLGNEKRKCGTYFEKYLLALDRPLVLALDELDRVYPYPKIAGHFLGMLRTWHESAKTKEIWKRLRLVVVYVEAYTQMSDDQSPFNVGTVIELPIFTQEQISELVQRYQLAWEEAQVTQLGDVLGGLPDLVHQAVSHLSAYPDTTLTELLAKAPTFTGIYGEHLHSVSLSLQQQPELVTALKQVVTANSPVQLNWEQASKLYGMGLVQLQGNQVAPSCKLYRQFFCEQL